MGGEAFTSQMEAIDRQVEIVNTARTQATEEGHAQYLEEDYGNDLDCIEDTYDKDKFDEEDDWSSDGTVCGEEGCLLDGVYYVYPKAV